MTLKKGKEQDGMMLAKVKEQDGIMLDAIIIVITQYARDQPHRILEVEYRRIESAYWRLESSKNNLLSCSITVLLLAI